MTPAGDDATVAAYDKGAATFADDWHSHPPGEDLHAAVRRYFAPGATADIGCGSGRDVAWLNANGFRCTGFDASERMLAEARRRYPALTFVACALPDLPEIEAGSFQNVLCETVIMHLPQTAIVPGVRRMLDILKPGGAFYLTWRVMKGDGDQRDPKGRLYSAVDLDAVKAPLAGCEILLDEQVISSSSGNVIHRIACRKSGHAE